MHIYERLGVRRVINARSFSTKVGGCALPPEVMEAMREASDSCVRMDQLQEAASGIIAEATGAEAGMNFPIPPVIKRTPDDGKKKDSNEPWLTNPPRCLPRRGIPVARSSAR